MTKSQRITDSNGNLTTAIDVDPWGGETSRSSYSAFQPHRYTSYERDGNGNDQAGARTYHGFWLRFDQPDPYDGSYSLTEPQSLNRYSYVQNDPVNFVDPTGLSDDPVYHVYSWAPKWDWHLRSGGRNGGILIQPHYVVEPHDKGDRDPAPQDDKTKNTCIRMADTAQQMADVTSQDSNPSNLLIRISLPFTRADLQPH